MVDQLADGDDLAGGLMAEHDIVLASSMNLMQVAMTDAAGVLTNQDLVTGGRGQLHFV